MSIFAKIENGVAVEYPVYEGVLQQRFPNLKFPLANHVAENGLEVPEGYVKVVPNPIQNRDFTMKYTMGMPVLENGVWKENWTITPLTEEEKAKVLPGLSARLREQRDYLLENSDKYALVDTYAALTQEQQAQLMAYRQALRDLPNQAGFPWNVTWPETPSFVVVPPPGRQRPPLR